MSDYDKIIFLGDFNEDLTDGNSRIKACFETHHFLQKVHGFTTERFSQLDHVYVHGEFECLASIIPTYFSYHEAIGLSLSNNCLEEP